MSAGESRILADIRRRVSDLETERSRVEELVRKGDGSLRADLEKVENLLSGYEDALYRAIRHDRLHQR